MPVVQTENSEEPLLLVGQYDRRAELWPMKCAQHTLLVAGAAKWLRSDDKHLISAQGRSSRAKCRECIANSRRGLSPYGAILLNQPTELNGHRLIGDHLLAHPIRNGNVEVR
jgi:hypothetical protein